MDAFALPLAMAALAGASVAAVATYCMHRETLAQLLDFARAVEGDRDRDRDRGTDLEDAGGEYDSPNLHRKKGSQRRLRRKALGRSPGGGWPATLPDPAAASEVADGKRPVIDGSLMKESGAMMGEDHRSPVIPVGLSRLHTVPGGTYDSGSDFSPG